MAEQEGNVEEKEESGRKVTFNIDKLQNFPDWYERVLKVTDFIDNRYPLKGMVSWMPYGFKALKLMLKIIEEELDKTGHHETYFPMLVPESIFKKESDFLKGFKSEAYVVTRSGENQLAEPLYVRPTSETIMYQIVRLWIRSESELPLKIYQTVNVFRHETKNTKPMLRLREVAKFKEAHTFHASAEDAERQIKEGLDVYRRFFDALLIPYKVVKTVKSDTFAGAEYNYDMMCVMPDGKAIELASVINLGTKFAKAFGLQYRNSKNEMADVHQTCYGLSERELGVAVGVHGDNKGLLLPSVIAPVQVIVVPIAFNQNPAVLKKGKYLKELLEKKGFRVDIDETDYSPGQKFYYWETRGVPVRLEIGPKDMEKSEVVLARRDRGEKESVTESKVASAVKRLLKKYDAELRRRAKAYFSERVLKFKNVKELKEKYTERLGMAGLPWCGNEECVEKISTQIDMPPIGYDEEPSKYQCASCGSAGKTTLFFGRTY